MEHRRNIIWAFALALLACTVLNACEMQNVPFANSASDSHSDHPIKSHPFHR